MVSVPLRGKGRDQPGESFVLDGTGKTFPSPCGEKVGINNDHSMTGVEIPEGVSVPLRGKGRDQPL